MKKYIIKNCKAHIIGEMYKGACLHSDKKCTDVTDCLLKRIVEKCKEQKEPQIRDYKTDIEYFRYSARHSLAKEILSMLEIEELQDET